MRKIYGPSQGAEMIRGLLEAAKELGPDQFTLLYHLACSPWARSQSSC